MAPRSSDPLDAELADLPQALRWREWMARVEAVLFAASGPVGRDVLARVVGRDCALDLLIEDISAELVGRPYEIVRIAGGWQFRTRPQHAAAIRAARGEGDSARGLSQAEALVLTIIAYMQPVTRGAIARLTGREVSRDLIARLHRQALIARGPRSPEPGAPYTYVTTPGFLAQFGLATLRDLPDLEALEDAGLLKPAGQIALDLPIAAEEGRHRAGAKAPVDAPPAPGSEQVGEGVPKRDSEPGAAMTQAADHELIAAGDRRKKQAPDGG